MGSLRSAAGAGGISSTKSAIGKGELGFGGRVLGGVWSRGGGGQGGELPGSVAFEDHQALVEFLQAAAMAHADVGGAGIAKDFVDAAFIGLVERAAGFVEEGEARA